MEEVKIIRTVDLINGGCNACPTVEAEVYVMELNNLNRPLDALDVSSLIMTVALAKGYKQHQEYDLAEDYDVYKKDNNEISVIPEYGKLIFKKGSKQEKVANQYKDNAELFKIVNNLLKEYFEIEELEFVIENQD